MRSVARQVMSTVSRAVLSVTILAPLAGHAQSNTYATSGPSGTSSTLPTHRTQDEVADLSRTVRERTDHARDGADRDPRHRRPADPDRVDRMPIKRPATTPTEKRMVHDRLASDSIAK
jgi:hypothetical protein